MLKYSKQTRLLLAVDCIIFGFDGEVLKLLLIKRGFQPEKGNWSLMGGFVQNDESLDQAANRILKQLTGLEGVYLEQLYTFGEPHRDPMERTVSVAYFALIDIQKYETQISSDYHAEWFQLKRTPKLIFDQQEMLEQARKRIRYKRPCTLSFLNFYLQNSPSPNYKPCTNAFLIPPLINVILVKGYWPPVCLLNWPIKTRPAQNAARIIINLICKITTPNSRPS